MKGNPDPSLEAFCVRNHSGELIHAKIRRIPNEINLVAEALALRLRLEYCIKHNLMSLCFETDSLAVHKFVTNQWEIPWGISNEIRRIQNLIKGRKVVVQHIYRQGNQLADFLVNCVFAFAGTNNYYFSIINNYQLKQRSC